jgi:hypothetical protein
MKALLFFLCFNKLTFASYKITPEFFKKIFYLGRNEAISYDLAASLYILYLLHKIKIILILHVGICNITQERNDTITEISVPNTIGKSLVH